MCDVNCLTPFWVQLLPIVCWFHIICFMSFIRKWVNTTTVCNVAKGLVFPIILRKGSILLKIYNTSQTAIHVIFMIFTTFVSVSVMPPTSDSDPMTIQSSEYIDFLHKCQYYYIIYNLGNSGQISAKSCTTTLIMLVCSTKPWPLTPSHTLPGCQGGTDNRCSAVHQCSRLSSTCLSLPCVLCVSLGLQLLS